LINEITEEEIKDKETGEEHKIEMGRRNIRRI
jgi:hypothetical protein